MDKETNFRIRTNLTLVRSFVPKLSEPYLQRPIVTVVCVDGLKTIVAGIYVKADCQHMEVFPANPGNLKYMKIQMNEKHIYMCVQKSRKYLSKLLRKLQNQNTKFSKICLNCRRKLERTIITLYILITEVKFLFKLVGFPISHKVF